MDFQNLDDDAMGNGLDYRTLLDELPDWAAPAYDGLEIVL